MRLSFAPIVSFVAIAAIGISGCTVKVGTKKPEPPPPKAEPAPPPPEPEAKPKPKMKLKAEKIQLPGPVLFQTGSDKLLPESDTVLEVVRKYLEQNPHVTLLRIEGHTDTDGNDASNLDLSKRRAMSVAHWLTAKGTDCKRLLPVGFGETRLIVDPEKTPEDKATNRRVAFVTAHIKGEPIPGFAADGGGTAAGDPCQ